MAVNPESRSAYVERFARVLEATGGSRIAGRIFAHLATAPESYLSLQELAEQLQVSRASVSTNTRALIQLGLVTRVPVPGSRGEHYALLPDGARASMQLAAASAREIAGLAEEGLRLSPREVTPGRVALRSMSESYTELAKTFDALAARPKRRAQ